MKKAVKKFGKLMMAGIIAVVAVFMAVRYVSAENFNLNGIGAEAFVQSELSGDISPAYASKAVRKNDDMVDVNFSVRIPFKAVKKAFLSAAASNKRLSLINPEKPIIVQAGDLLVINNIRINIGGIIAEPVVRLKPYIAGKGTLDIVIERIKIHVSMTSSKSAAVPEFFSQEEIMAEIMDTAIKGIMEEIDRQLTEEKMPFRADEMLSLEYHEASWIFRVIVAPKLFNRLLPQMVGDTCFTGFSFNDSAMFINIGTEK